MELTNIDSGNKRVDIWFTFSDNIIDKSLLDRYRQLLSAEERHRETCFHFKKDQHRYLVSRALVRTALSAYAPIAPADWAFNFNAYGKPSIANSIHSALSFNLSHTDGLSVLAVARGIELGIDTENMFARETPLNSANHYLNPSETTALYALNDRDQLLRFYEHWTLKEAYIKARGLGLSLPLDQFSFDLNADGAIKFTAHADLFDHSGCWTFVQWRPTPAHVVALSTKHRADKPIETLLRETIPLHGEKIISIPSTRKSF